MIESISSLVLQRRPSAGLGLRHGVTSPGRTWTWSFFVYSFDSSVLRIDSFEHYM